MKAMRLMLLTGLVLAVSGTAWAVTVPSYPGGPVFLSSRNQDNGSVYLFTSAVGANAQTFLTSGGLPVNTTKIAANEGIGSEDTWGIALMYHIQTGVRVSPGSPGTTINPTGDAAGTYDNAIGTQGTWLTIVFWGGVDQKVSMTPGFDINGNAIVTETVWSSGLNFAIYAVDKAAIAAQAGTVVGEMAPDAQSLQNYVSGQRTGGGSGYTGWAGTVPGEVLLVDGTSSYFRTDFQVNNATGHINQGTTTVYFDVNAAGTGLWDAAWGTANQLITPFDPSAPASMRGQVTDAYFDFVNQNSTNGWSVASRDNGGVFAIPEPVTMLGVFLGVSGLAGYIRRRKLA